MFEKKVPIPFDEQETVVTMDYERDLAFVYSSRYTMVAKLEQLVEEYPNETTVEFDNRYGLQISVPIEWVKIKPPRKLSKEEKARRAALARRTTQAREEARAHAKSDV